MKKNLYLSFILLVAFGLFLVGNCAHAQTVSDENGFEGTLTESGTVKLTKHPKAASVVIPDTIDGYPVTEIGNSCFYVDKTIESVEIPASVKVIGENGFNYCTNLKSVVFKGDGLEKIGDDAFFSCDLQQFKFPSTVQSVGNRAFGYIAASSITVPKSVTSWGKNVFFSGKLKSVSFEEGTKIVSDGMFYGCSQITDVKLSSSIEEIQDSAFACGSDCVINEIVLPASLKKIGDYAFYNIRIKKLVNNATSVVDISDSAFSGTKIDQLVSKDNNGNNDSNNNNSNNNPVKPNVEVQKPNIYLSSNNEVFSMGKTVQLKVINAVGTTKWSSSNTKVATVSSSGLVKGISKGNAVITAVNNGVTMTCKVQVLGLSLNKKKANVTVGYTTKLKLPGAKKVKWKSSNKRVATVNKSGVVKGVKTGKATITATYKKKKYKCKVRVLKNTCKLTSYSTRPADYPSNTAALGFSQVTMNSNGDLVVDGHILNNFSGTITSIDKITIRVFVNNKVVAHQGFSSYGVNVPARSCKKISFTIDKKNVKKKKCDLRNGDVVVTFYSNGVYHY